MASQCFSCPACAEPTGELLATAGCSVGHAMCPDCAAQWFSTCSRCPLCNSNVQFIHVHLLSSGVSEADPQTMLRTIQERSLEKAVFKVRPQTQLQNYLTEEDMNVPLPADMCQACDTETDDIRCGSCGDAYHLACAGLRRVPTNTWCCPRCVGIDGATRIRYAREDTAQVGPADASNHVSSEHMSQIRTRQQRRNHQILHYANTAVQRRGGSSGTSDTDTSTSPSASSGSLEPASQQASPTNDIQMGYLCAASLKSAVSCLHALRDRHAKAEVCKQRRPRMRHRSNLDLREGPIATMSSTAGQGPRPTQQCSSAASSRVASLWGTRGVVATASRSIVATRGAAGLGTSHACASSQSMAANTSRAAANVLAVCPARTATSPARHPASAVTCRASDACSRLFQHVAQPQGEWVSSGNPFKRKRFVPRECPPRCAPGSGTSSRPEGTACRDYQRQGASAGSEARRRCGSPVDVSVNINSGVPIGARSLLEPGHWPTSEALQHHNNTMDRGHRYTADGEAGPCVKMTRLRQSASLDQVDNGDGCQHPTESCSNSTIAMHTTAQTMCTPGSQEVIALRRRTASATARTAAFSKKLMRKAFECFAFKGALPEEEFQSSADAAADALTACITNASHPIKGSDAQEFANEVMEPHSLIFTDKRQCSATRYVKKEVVKYSLSESSRMCAGR